MATSGSTDFTLNAGKVVTYALRKIGVVAADEEPNSLDMQAGIEELNLMLKSWQMSGPHLWRQTQGSLALTADTASYAMSSVLRVTSARFRQNSRDLPMEVMTREEYFDLPMKTTQGIPTQYYFDTQRAAGSCTLYIWPVLASVSTETVEYTYQRRLEDIDAKTNDLDIPQEHLQTVGYNLAALLADTFQIADAVANRILQRAEMLKSESAAHDREPVIRFEPMRR